MCYAHALHFTYNYNDYIQLTQIDPTGTLYCNKNESVMYSNEQQKKSSTARYSQRYNPTVNWHVHNVKCIENVCTLHKGKMKDSLLVFILAFSFSCC